MYTELPQHHIGTSNNYYLMFQVKDAYIYFLIHCYVDTEVEMKEVYTSQHIWTLFDNFLLDMARVKYCLHSGLCIILIVHTQKI